MLRKGILMKKEILSMLKVNDIRNLSMLYMLISKS